MLSSAPQHKGYNWGTKYVISRLYLLKLGRINNFDGKKGDNTFAVLSVWHWIGWTEHLQLDDWYQANKSYCVRLRVWRQSINKIRDYEGIPGPLCSHHNDQKWKIQKVQIQNSDYEYKNTNTKIQSINKIRDYGGSNAPSMLSTDSREIKWK